MNDSRFGLKRFVTTLALSAIVFQSFAMAAPLSLTQRPLNSGKPPAPNMIVSIDDSGSMREESCYDPSLTYPQPLNGSGAPITVTFGMVPEDGWGTLSTATVDLTKVKENCNGGKRKYIDFPATGSRTLAEERVNIATWYSYYRSRMNKVKSAMTRAFSPNVLPNESIRLGFQTLSSCDDWGVDCKPDSKRSTTFENRMRVLTASRRQEFWNFLTMVGPWQSTPLRPTLTRAGQYYEQTGINGPMASVPGTAEQPVLSCRKNFHVLLTDGQWNQGDGLIAKNLTNTSFSLPDGKSYTAQAPYSGGTGAYGTTLADIALHYWKTDLQPSLDNNVSPVIRVPGTSNAAGVSQPEYWNPVNNPATWQHMVNFTIGVDLSSSLQDQGIYPVWGGSTFANNSLGYPALLSGARGWPNMNDFYDRTYDLWRMAINSRGEFYSADEPAAVEKAFRSIIQQILAAGSQGQTIGGSGPRVGVGSAVYLGNYNSDMSGSLTKKSQNADGSVATASLWEAGSLLKDKAPTSRVILSHSGTQPIAFKWSDLSSTQKAALNTIDSTVDTRGEDRLNWLRGDRSKELGSPTVTDPTMAFRARGSGSLLGSVVGSAPVLVGKNASGFAGTSYRSFLTGTVRTRTPVVYVGANDGMLHGFRDDTGEEVLGYVPKGVYERLARLTSPSLPGQYSVNGSPFVGDANVGGQWRSVLVGTMAGGGKGLFMLDVTNPANFSESNPSATVLMDLAGSDDADLGHIMGQSPISTGTAQSLLLTKLPNNRTVLLVGNGVNSDNENPVLFVFHLDSFPSGKWTLGTNYFKVSPTGSGVSGSNGLAMPVPADVDGDGQIDTLYAGDLKGNLWKFEYDASTPSGFKVGNAGEPLFTAPTDAGKPQPMTANPEVMVHPKGGVMVVQGTGQLMQESDPNNSQVQTIYGIWDKPNATGKVGMDSLVAQTVTGSFAGGGKEFRTISKNKVDFSAGKRGWYVNLPTSGERSVAGPQLFGASRVLVPTVIPVSANGESCSPGISPGWWMVFDFLTGGASDTPLYDTNGDKKITKGDPIANGMKVNNGEARPYLGKTTPSSTTKNGDVSDPLSRCTGGLPPPVGAAGESSQSPPEGRCGRLGWTQLKN